MIKKSLVFFFFLFILSYVSAGAWENVPLPGQTVKLKEEEALVNGKKINFIYCRSSLSAQDIANFYLRFLPGMGWQEDCPECREKGMNAPLVLTRSGTKITINIIPNPIETGKNEVIITLHESDKEPRQLPEEGEDAPGTDLPFLPRYPASQRLSSFSREAGKKAILAYTTTDSLEEVLSFYQQKMMDYDWELVMNIDFQDLFSSPQFAQLKKEVKLEEEWEEGGGGLIFKGPHGECIVSVIADPKEKGVNIIGVKYNAK